jgi:hypothetical protein
LSTFLVFTDDFLNHQLQDENRKEKLWNFFKEIANDKFGCIFLPEDLNEFVHKMGATMIELSYPTILNIDNIGDLMSNNGKISLSSLNDFIKLRKVGVEKGIVFASSGQALAPFDKGFDLFLVDENKTPGHNGQYQTVNNLADILPILRQK